MKNESKTETTNTKGVSSAVETVVMQRTNLPLFKILMCDDVVVDVSMLDVGIYASSNPVLYDYNATINGLVNRALAIKDIEGKCMIPYQYIENLQKCQLVDVRLLFA